MKRWLVMYVCIFLLLVSAASPAMAARVPEKNGNVVDNAQFFTKAQSQKIAKAAKQGPLQFHVLTLNTLNGEDSAAFATKAYKAWKLGKNDVILVISKSEHRIEFNFHNAKLQDAIDGLPNDYDKNGKTNESKLTEFLQAHFIPSARKGNYAQAALQTINSADQLYAKSVGAAASPAKDSPKSGSKAATNSNAKPNSNSKSNANAKPNVPSSSSPATNNAPSAGVQAESNPFKAISFTFPTRQVVTGLIVLLLLGIALLFLYGWLLKRKWEKERGRFAELMVMAERANTTLQPFVGLSQGTTEQIVRRLDNALSQHLIDLSERKQATERSTFLLRFKRIKQHTAGLKEELDQTRDQIAQLNHEVEQLHDTDLQMDQRIVQMTNTRNKIQDLLTKATADTGLPLTALHETYRRLDSSVQEVAGLEIFDPMEAETRSNLMQPELDLLQEHVIAVPVYLSKYNSLPVVLQEYGAELYRITQSNQIELAIARLNPGANIEQARGRSGKMYLDLQNGRIDMVIKLSTRIDELLTEALDTAKRQVEWKAQNPKDIAAVRAKHTELTSGAQSIRAQFTLIRPRFAQHHWFELYEKLEQSISALTSSLAQVQEAERLTSASVQEYDTAHEKLEEQFDLMEQTEVTISGCRALFTALEQRWQQVNMRTEQSWQDFGQTESLISRESLPSSSWQMLLSQIRNQYQSIQSQLQVAPIDLDQVETQIAPLRDLVVSLSQQVQRKLEEKHETERRWADMQRQYDSTYSRVGRRINHSVYTSQYHSVQSETSYLIQNGQYDQALIQMSVMDQMIRQMNQDYNQVLEQERRREELQRQARQSSSDWSSSGGGSHSSGGSSGGGGSSSNDNRPSGGGGNSSGGANW